MKKLCKKVGRRGEGKDCVYFVIFLGYIMGLLMDLDGLDVGYER